MLKKCGHVMCKKCLEETSMKTKKCGVCSENTDKDDIINLSES